MQDATIVFNLRNIILGAGDEFMNTLLSQITTASQKKPLLTEEEKFRKKKAVIELLLELIELEMSTASMRFDGHQKKVKSLRENIYPIDKYEKEIKYNVKKRSALSNREKEILYYSSVGKTYNEVAIMLGIKVPTVKFHMGNVVKKLNVLNSRQAIAQGIKLRILDLPFVDAAGSARCHSV